MTILTSTLRLTRKEKQRDSWRWSPGPKYQVDTQTKPSVGFHGSGSIDMTTWTGAIVVVVVVVAAISQGHLCDQNVSLCVETATKWQLVPDGTWPLPWIHYCEPRHSVCQLPALMLWPSTRPVHEHTFHEVHSPVHLWKRVTPKEKLKTNQREIKWATSLAAFEKKKKCFTTSSRLYSGCLRIYFSSFGN